LASGTVLKLVASGSRLALSVNGVERVVVTDAGLTGGAPGLMTYGLAQADNWAGGDAGSPPPPPPPPAAYSGGGGAAGVSGGTVVLQDNGGDDLSVSANGSFAFATKLASGAAYAVTVKTNPAGQTCTVSAGSGTVAQANVTSVVVSCSNQPPPATYSVGGSVS